MAEMLYSIDSFAVDGESTADIQAHMAQLVEHVLGKDEVTGSIPVVGSIFPLLTCRGNGIGMGKTERYL